MSDEYLVLSPMLNEEDGGFTDRRKRILEIKTSPTRVSFNSIFQSHC
jgi:hypothetical protein